MTAYEKINGKWVLQGSAEWFAYFGGHQTGLEVGRVLSELEIRALVEAHGAVRYVALVDEVNSKTQIVLYFREVVSDAR